MQFRPRGSSPMAASKTSHVRLEAEETRKKILALRLSGATIPQIAGQVGRSVSTVHKHLTKALARSITLNDTEAEKLREVELLRLDYYLRQIDKPIRENDVQAVGEARRISQRRSKLLGIDRVQPQTLEVPAGSRVTVTIPDNDRGAGE